MHILSPSDGRQLVAPVVAQLHQYGARVRSIGVYLTAEGLLFHADVNGRVVSYQTGAGTVPYATVAIELLAATLQPAAEPRMA